MSHACQKVHCWDWTASLSLTVMELLHCNVKVNIKTQSFILSIQFSTVLSQLNSNVICQYRKSHPSILMDLDKDTKELWCANTQILFHCIISVQCKNVTSFHVSTSACFFCLCEVCLNLIWKFPLCECSSLNACLLLDNARLSLELRCKSSFVLVV